MPASTHVKFFEYKPSGKDRKLQKTQTGCHSTFPIHLIRDVNQATTQNREQHRSSPLNTSHSSNSSNSTKSSSKTVNAPNNQFKPIPQSTQPTIVQPIHQSKQPFVPPLFHVTHPPKQLPPHPACISTTTTVQPTHYYAQALPSISHSYLKTIIHPVAVPPQSQHYLVHYHPHQSYHHAINNTIPTTSYPVRISHGISKTLKMAHPVRQIRSSQPLSEKIYDLQLDKSRQPLLIGDSYASLSRPATSPLKTTQIPVVSKETYRKDEQLVLSSSPPTVGVYSKLPSKISNSDLVYPCTTPTSHLNVGSQTLPSIADLFGSTQSKTFRSAISISDILN